MKTTTRLTSKIIATSFIVSLFGNTTVFAQTSASPDSGVGAFVARLYTICLERGYDQGGFENWCNQLISGSIDGGTVARGFFNSDEYLYVVADNDAQYLTKLYEVFFNREPDACGFDGWYSQLDGSPEARKQVMEGFIDSAEWTNTCMEYGIISGSGNSQVAKNNVDSGIETFINSLYEGCLGRSADAEGFNGWALKLTNKEVTGRDVAYGFFYSSEFFAKYNSISVEEKVETFYEVFFNRSADEAGLNSWCSILENGATLDTLFNGFSQSAEFMNKCKACGILYSMSDLDLQTNYNPQPSLPQNNVVPADDLVAIVTSEPTPTPFVANQCSSRFNNNDVVTVVVDLGNGETKEVTGYYDYKAEEEILECLNEMRIEAGVEPLVMTDDLRDAARLRAAELVCSPTHDRPNGESCFTAIPWHNAGGENIAAGFTSGSEFNQQWYNSEGHRANMLNSDYTGVGIAVFISEGSVYGEYGSEAFSG